jgi:carbamoyltransferase
MRTAPTLILGLNAFHGDSSAALLSNGEIISAVEEERLNRIKHWAGLPIAAAKQCLNGTTPQHIAISRDPRANLAHKLLRTALRPRQWLRTASRAANASRLLFAPGDLRQAAVADRNTNIHFVEHHRAHLASAFFASPFDEAAVLSIDGFGDFSSVMWGVGRGRNIDIHGSVTFPHSLGLYYTAFTQFLGFPKYGDEYKMMGLAAYGEPRYVDQVRQVVRTVEGQVRLNLDYFTHHTEGIDMTWENSEPTLGKVYSTKMLQTFGSPRPPRSDILPEHADLAASVQAVLEENYFALLRYTHKQTGLSRICLAGGVALNCAANGKIFEQTPFTDLYIQPAANDAGTSIGAALHVWHHILGNPRSFIMRHVYYGPEYTPEEIRSELEAANAVYHGLDRETLLARAADEIAAGSIVGWFQGRMEFGPRALGNRSILADPRRHDMKEILNSRIKYREPFRPFCPSVLAESVGDWFETDYPAPFMVTAYRIKPGRQASVPAIRHEDGTGRLQTVERNTNPLYWALIRRFADRTGVPLLLNTSFNENEPIVNTPAEALDCFSRTKMDVLVLGPFLVLKSENTQLESQRRAFADLASMPSA